MTITVTTSPRSPATPFGVVPLDGAPPGGRRITHPLSGAGQPSRRHPLGTRKVTCPSRRETVLPGLTCAGTCARHRQTTAPPATTTVATPPTSNRRSCITQSTTPGQRHGHPSAGQRLNLDKPALCRGP